jgi:XTP/dITP diphosphohydrolase
VLASANAHKAEEIRPLLSAVGVDVVAAIDLIEGWDVEETGVTLEENARLKARAAVERTGEAAVGDDTGLFVDGLGGLPGVRSSRYAGPGATYADNVARLLDALAGVPVGHRTARFRTVALLVAPDGREIACEGELEGTILEAPRGEHGFGYDPVFLLPQVGRSLAELDLEEKNRWSHRAMAFRALAAFLATHEGWLEPEEVPSLRAES